METCATLGMLTPDQAHELKDAGLDYYNHNVDTSPEFYGEIITTRTYQDRLDTLAAVRDAGLNVCCGGIVGMGETTRDRASMLATLANLPQHPESVPINQLVRVPGTPLAGKAAVRFGARPTFWASFAVAALGLPFLLLPNLVAIMGGLVLVAVGTFFAQAAATGFVSRAATTERGAASGIYLASYYLGGLAGSAAMGVVFDMFGWTETVIALGVALAVAAAVTIQIKEPG